MKSASIVTSLLGVSCLVALLAPSVLACPDVPTRDDLDKDCKGAAGNVGIVGFGLGNALYGLGAGVHPAETCDEAFAP